MLQVQTALGSLQFSLERLHHQIMYKNFFFFSQDEQVLLVIKEYLE